MRSGRPDDCFGDRSVIREPRAASEKAMSTGVTVGVVGSGSAAKALGRTVMTGVPRTTSLVARQVPEKTDWVARTPASPGPRSTASVTMPESSRTATRAATSLPSGPEVTKTAAGEVVSTRWTSASALGRQRNCSASSPPTAYTVVAPYSPSWATTASLAPPNTTALGLPSSRAAVSSSRLALRTPSPALSIRTSTSDMSAPSAITAGPGRPGSRRAGRRRCRRR